ncbi:GDP-mannose 4,6-dehydratase, partial [bacterium]|nr:GDP-mannose 4,6-dehydratase [bacterium]
MSLLNGITSEDEIAHSYGYDKILYSYFIGHSAMRNGRNIVQDGVNKIVFSSTAAVYGEPDYTPIDENHPTKPINPYGKTKLMIENIMDDYNKAYGLKSV